MLPSGYRQELFFSDDQDRQAVVEEILLEPHEAYCIRNWLNDNKKGLYSPEERVKYFLDGCANVLLHGNSEGILSRYKEIMRGKTEIPVSSCPSFLKDYLFSGSQAPVEELEDGTFELILEDVDSKAEIYTKKKPGKKKERAQTRFERIQSIRADYPGCEMTTCIVDTENFFECFGNTYQVDDAVKQYQPKRTREGMIFDMDRVIGVEAEDGEIAFFDQDMFHIADELVHRIR